MKLLVVSDLHFEFHRDGGAAFASTLRESCELSGVDAMVVAGDLCDWRTLPRSLDLLAQMPVPVVYVAGNHEHYRSSLGAMREFRRVSREFVRQCVAQRASARHDVHWLDCSSVEIKGRRFLGCTLWFPLGRTAIRYAHMMNDFRRVRGLSADVAHENRRAREFLEREVREGDVVVTHHLPSSRSTPARFERSPLNQFYVSPCDGLIERARPALWVHGHTHDSADYELGATRVVCNPYGYAGHEVNPAFDPGFVVELPDFSAASEKST